ncbi:hypothetical protein ACFL1H_00800 [Nanoarchaeota archaeon]
MEINHCKWLRLLERIGAKGNYLTFYDKIVQPYSDPNRFYHNINHVMDMLLEFKQVKDKLNNPDAVEYAIWSHDCVYEVGNNGKSNEQRSADIAVEVCKELSIEDDFANNVKDLVLATEYGFVNELNDDQKYFVDMDLAVLGKPKLKYLKYLFNVRNEYQMYGTNEFTLGRHSFMSKEFDGPIYNTEYFRNKYENQAKINLKDEKLILNV